MKAQKRSKHKITQDELNAEQFMNKIPSALLELQRRGLLLPQKEKLEIDELHIPPLTKEEETEQEAQFSNQVLNVFERHERQIANALTGIYKTSIKNSTDVNQEFNKSQKIESFSIKNEASSYTGGINESFSQSFTHSSTSSDHAVNHILNRARDSFGIREPQKLLNQLSDNVDGIKGQNTLNFQLPEIPTSKKGGTKIEIGKLIEQVNIHSQDISGGSQQLVKVLKEKLVEILQDELNTKY